MLSQKEIKSIKKRTTEDDHRLPVMLGALSDPRRFQILRILMNHHEICVTDIATILGITVSAASQQLRILERVGLVRRERLRQMACYEVRDDDPMVKSLSKLFSAIK